MKKISKKRYILSIIAVCLIGIIYMLAFGKQATIKEYIGNLNETSNLIIENGNEEVLKINNFYEKDNYVFIDISSLKMGDSTIKIKYEQNDMIYQNEIDIKVNTFNIISSNMIIAGSEGLVIASLIDLLITVIFFARKLKEYDKKTLYSYANVSILSLIIFIVFTICGVSRYILHYIFSNESNIFNSFDILSLFENIIELPMSILMILIPFVIVISFAICISSISLIIHEGKKLKNYIGAIVRNNMWDKFMYNNK